MSIHPFCLRAVAAALLAPAMAHAYVLNGYTFNDGPVGTGKDNAVIMVHGWTSNPNSWPSSMETAIVGQLTQNGQIGQWDTWRYDWATDAVGGTISPSDTALRNAQVHGQHLADWILQQTAGGGYQHVHLIGHSLGGRVIETAAVKLQQRGITLHQTFLDAYTPKVWEAVYGEVADYAEHYYNDDTFIVETQDDFANSHNIDVTDVSGGPGGNTFGSGHSWPYEWYRNTVNNPGSAPQGYGFALSKEFVGDSWQPPSNRPAGRLVDLPGGSPPGSVAAQRRITRARKSYNSIANPGDQLTLSAGQSINVPINTSDIGSTNYLDFRFDFAARSGGNLTVQVGSNVLTHIQEAFSLDGLEWSGKLMLGGDLGPGTHTVTFTLTGGSSVVLDDISLGYYRDIASQSPGDANVNGVVDIDDLRALARFYGQTIGMDWDRGDFDLDGDVDLNDLANLAAHYNGGAQQAFADFQMLAVPEPATVLLFACASLIARPRRRK